MRYKNSVNQALLKYVREV